ncbi:unnamed protein product [Rotaria sp. Silwood2]|nr:unnamed protein product [Rotaria sp. Silwood2]CAF4647635.1 unnamed protein product [Rotaria sp. Silwood2]CAF4739967.1 unnamed protein product [Rotaria sp. Silwood2]
MSSTRYGHTASLLTNEKILVTGGYHHNMTNTVELYDPSTEDWTTFERMNYVRYYHTASVLSNGKVLVTGGFTSEDLNSNAAELY